LNTFLPHLLLSSSMSEQLFIELWGHCGRNCTRELSFLHSALSDANTPEHSKFEGKLLGFLQVRMRLSLYVCWNSVCTKCNNRQFRAFPDASIYHSSYGSSLSRASLSLSLMTKEHASSWKDRGRTKCPRFVYVSQQGARVQCGGRGACCCYNVVHHFEGLCVYSQKSIKWCWWSAIRVGLKVDKYQNSGEDTANSVAANRCCGIYLEQWLCVGLYVAYIIIVGPTSLVSLLINACIELRDFLHFSQRGENAKSRKRRD
jgi:hypothetical protein